jgi:flagellar basal body-associated protein FliL
MVYHKKVEKFILKNEKVHRIINITLLCIIGVLVALLITGSIYALTRSSNAEPLFTIGDNRTRQVPAASEAEDIRIFTGLGQLRIPLTNSSTLILVINFPYPANDTAFTEELAVKIGDLKAIAVDYFSTLPTSSLIHIDEDIAKQEILRRFNDNLRLGRITTLLFSNMLIID